MSTALLARDPDLSRLLDDGYNVVLQAGHIIVQIPYVTESRTVEHGFLAHPVTVAGDRLVSETDHRIWFGGSTPCDERGRPLTVANPDPREIAGGRQANFMLSSKPPDGYPDQYAKITAYVRIVADHAHALDSSATPTPGAAWQEIDDDSPFAYRDTATSRAGISAVNRRFRGHRVVIIGLGGSGSYILDQVAKTEVDSILLIDGDTFDNHNAFRAPGAAALDTLRERPLKATYFAAVYANMHQGVAACPKYLDEDNLDLLEGATFAFLASDDAASKPAIIGWLEAHEVPFIDVGMGIEEIDGRLSGLLRITTSLPGRRDAARDRIPRSATERDAYASNIQTADLNALNAVLAVIRWKRSLDIYADATGESHTTYSLITNEIANEDLP
ncbi:ThiF family adenylyltransferase [Streptomyces goshikiensis]|uniref:ThiF family adenylyltransferase n=2 Tax=Streptomyces TaxID=1883 RepID=A0A5D4IG10_9ACTN|nr:MULTISPECIES: ThiF family adenylyltransferase [Streptomyces]ALO08275.1 UBA/THIF-type NAD/FAD binding fold protein [Streptomyces venezuelae]QPK45505.1 ThiF family adenylyltransferase [Streptomyces gardneri]TYR52058.1 ThiF family adenylyltransferase [Streptomyces parvus]WRK36843.1 ThiF family adenylyltransferase [Streptomyces venezuelae]CUM41374.1 COG0476: Dinucleotide-utilizing enzymes involved in molybdopterin and thiamine biosynthesis family 2 [Streptomyces venezuelae]